MKIKALIPDKIFDENLELDAITKKSLEIYETKTVLGVDIYRYSEYIPEQQMYIPVLFEKLYHDTIKNCLLTEPLIFKQHYKNKEEFTSHFISTGDGGFQIFDNPLQAIVFSIYFQLGIKRFNSGGDGSPSLYLKTLRALIGRIELRYAVTVDKIYEFNKNFYGPAIINNARIMSKDNLNRLLIDENVLDWFDQNFNSIENLSVLSPKDFSSIDFFKAHDLNMMSALFKKAAIKTIDVLKIGAIKIKSTELRIYNLHIQAGLTSGELDPKRYKYYSMTLGNLNTKGIE